MENMGLRGNISSFILTFLSDRSVVIKNDNSLPRDFKQNIETDHVSDGQVFLYADDTTIVVTDDSRVLDEFSRW